MTDTPIAQHYRSLLDKYGDSPGSAQWADESSQFRRFKVLNQIGNLKGRTVLDYGCGCAAFAQYLKITDQDPSLYCGVDLVEEFFAYARIKYPEGTYLLPDQLSDSSSFDYVFVSGVFNNKIDDNSGFWRKTILRLFDIARVGLAFNMLSTYVDYNDPTLYYEDPCAVFRFLKENVSPYVSIRHDYLPREDSYPYEFTSFVRKTPYPIL